MQSQWLKPNNMIRIVILAFQIFSATKHLLHSNHFTFIILGFNSITLQKHRNEAKIDERKFKISSLTFCKRIARTASGLEEVEEEEDDDDDDGERRLRLAAVAVDVEEEQQRRRRREE